MYAAVASRSRSSTSSPCSASSAANCRYSSPHAVPPLWLVPPTPPVWWTHQSAGALTEERGGSVGVGPQEHPHLGDAAAREPVDERIVRLECLALTAEYGMLPLDGP